MKTAGSFILGFIAGALITVAAGMGFIYFSARSGATEKVDRIRTNIIEKERADLPLRVQSFENVYGITVDSLVITNDTKPYSGYLVTQWDINEKQKLSASEWAANGYKDKYVRKTKTAYVEIKYIFVRGGKVSWYSEWSDTYFDIKEN